MIVKSQVNCIRIDKAASSALLYLGGELLSHIVAGFKAKVLLFQWIISLLVGSIMIHWLRVRISMFFESKFYEWH